MQNSVDPDKTPHSAASDLGLHCLPVSLLGNARHKWVNVLLHQILYHSLISSSVDHTSEESDSGNNYH